MEAPPLATGSAIESQTERGCRIHNGAPVPFIHHQETSTVVRSIVGTVGETTQQPHILGIVAHAPRSSISRAAAIDIKRPVKLKSRSFVRSFPAFASVLPPQRIKAARACTIWIDGRLTRLQPKISRLDPYRSAAERFFFQRQDRSVIVAVADAHSDSTDRHVNQ
jgi:hypothetical protein